MNLPQWPDAAGGRRRSAARAADELHTRRIVASGLSPEPHLVYQLDRSGFCAMAEIRRVIAIGLLLAALLASAAAGQTFTPSPTGLSRFEFAQAHMGTQFRIVLYARDAEIAAKASTAAFERIARLDATMSDYRETSELMMACKQAVRRWVQLSPDLFRILALSQQVARRSAGAFDVTVGPVVRLWRRARRANALPDAKKLAAARQRVGYR